MKYQYKCDKCGKEYTVECKIAEREEKAPTCCEEKAARVYNGLTRIGESFKGNGGMGSYSSPGDNT